MARIARALNDATVPCPSAADPGRNPHRSGTAWTLHTVRAILANPRYTGRQAWNRQRTDCDLVDPANTGLGHRPVQRWNLPEGWIISGPPPPPPHKTEADFIAAQDLTARRGPDSPAGRRYQLAGLLRCGTCERLMESCWSNGKPAYRCRHGHTTATRPDAESLYPRGPDPAPPPGSGHPSRRPGHSCGIPKQDTKHTLVPAGAAEVIRCLRAKSITLIYDPDQHTLRAATQGAASVTIDRGTTAERR
jgi:site-specific DNA recombinase